MGVIRSRATIEEQQSSNEVEQPLLKKLCPFVDTPVGDEESESDSEGEEHEDDEDEDEEESESDSGEEVDGSLAVPANNNPKLNMVVNQECLNNNHKQRMALSEEEGHDSSESESVGGSEGSNSPKALDLLGKEEGKVSQDAFNSFFVPNVYRCKRVGCNKMCLEVYILQCGNTNPGNALGYIYFLV